MGTCESCGREGEATVKVQRIYLVPAGEGGPAGASPAALESAALESGMTPVAGDIERWCASCCGTFPHVLITEDHPAGDSPDNVTGGGLDDRATRPAADGP
jgi:hypothetical protein